MAFYIPVAAVLGAFAASLLLAIALGRASAVSDSQLECDARMLCLARAERARRGLMLAGETGRIALSRKPRPGEPQSAPASGARSGPNLA